MISEQYRQGHKINLKIKTMKKTVEAVLSFISDNWNNGIAEKCCNYNQYFGIYKDDSNILKDYIYIGNDYIYYPDFEEMMLYVENRETGKVKKFKIRPNQQQNTDHH